MKLDTYKTAKAILDRVEEIENQLILFNNDYDNYIISFYDKNSANENDGNLTNPDDSNQKINKLLIDGDLKKAIADYLFEQKKQLLEEFSKL